MYNHSMVLKIAVSPDLIGGDVDEGYGKVADAFRANFAAGREVGAAVAVYRDGVKVVDMWGGYRNGIAKAPWQHDTMVNMFSTTKGVAGLAIALAVSRGLFGYDDKVADHWPEFAQAGKADVTVRQLLGHQAGLCVLKPAPTVQDVADPARLSPMLAAQKPAWPPGTRHGYHGITLGWYESELIRRTDPAGRTLGRFFADEIAGPLGLDLHIGLPESVRRERVAHMHSFSRAEALLHLNVMPAALVAASFNPVGLLARTAALPRGVVPWAGDYNRDDVRAIEIPSANGIGTAGAVAQALQCCRDRRCCAGPDAYTCSTSSWPSRPHRAADSGTRCCASTPSFRWDCQSRRRCACSDRPTKPSARRGSAAHLASPTPIPESDSAYVMNRMGFHLVSDPRELALRQALFRDVLGARPQK